MTKIPDALSTYMEGLRQHDISRIASTFSDETRFVTPVRQMNKAQTLEFLTALYEGFPDWHYDNDPPEHRGGENWAVRWRQGGIHTDTLALPGYPEVPPTHSQVIIPEHYFFYKVKGDHLIEIRPDPVPGGAPRGIFEQIGVELPPL